MTVRRWLTTTSVMVGVGWGLLLLAPDRVVLDLALADPQQLVDTHGPDALVVVVAWALAAGCWLWGSAGLLLTVAGTRTGIGGRVARLLLTVVLPAGARRAAALAVGLSLTTAPLAAGVAASLPPGVGTVAVVTAGADATSGPVTRGAAPYRAPVDGAPDWSTDEPAQLASAGPLSPAPDWPAGHPDDARVVLRGDCLWDIAADWLADRSPGTPPDDAAVAGALRSWWQANATVIGPDPDRLLPGQVLRAPQVP